MELYEDEKFLQSFCIKYIKLHKKMVKLLINFVT